MLRITFFLQWYVAELARCDRFSRKVPRTFLAFIPLTYIFRQHLFASTIFADPSLHASYISLFRYVTNPLHNCSSRFEFLKVSEAANAIWNLKLNTQLYLQLLLIKRCVLGISYVKRYLLQFPPQVECAALCA